MKQKETPAIIYSTLKLYETIRSTTLIDNFFSIWHYVYRMIVFVIEITKKLIDIQIKHYMKNVFAPSLLK